MSSGEQFTRKALRLTVSLGEGTFGDTLSDTVELEGFRMLASLEQTGGESMGMCNVKVFGMRPELINQLTSIGTINKAVRLKNSIFLDADNGVDGWQNVFQGTIFDAYADYNQAPDVGFNVIAYSGLSAALKPVQPTSYKGSVGVAQVMQDFADEAGLLFEDFGVDVQLASPYFQGTSLAKIRKCARDAGIFHVIDRGTLVIAPITTARGSEVPEVSKETGMIGYPTLSSKGMSIASIYNPTIELGNNINVTSAISMACGKWNVTQLSHSLSSEMPDGPWFTYLECASGKL